MHRIYRWEAVEGPGLEHLDLRSDSDGIRARGVVIGTQDGADYGLTYTAFLTPDWLFRRVEIRRSDGASLDLARDDDGRWTAGETELPELEGCIDIDLSGSPFTNALPVNRTPWVDGRPERFDMAWIAMDSLSPQRDGQIYTRLRPGRFRYQAADGSFEAEISTDEDGIVTDYPGLFRRF